MKFLPALAAAWLALTLPSLASAAAPAKPEAARAASKKPPTPAQLAQREKMRSCAATARSRGVSGAPRKEFMRSCLSGH